MHMSLTIGDLEVDPHLTVMRIPDIYKYRENVRIKTKMLYFQCMKPPVFDYTKIHIKKDAKIKQTKYQGSLYLKYTLAYTQKI